MFLHFTAHIVIQILRIWPCTGKYEAVTSQSNHTTIFTIDKVSDHQNSVRSIYLLVSCERIITHLHQTNAHYTALLKNTTFKSIMYNVHVF